MGLIHSSNSGPQSVRDFCISLGTVLEDERRYQTL